MSEIEDLCLAIATEAHRGQVDKAGADYIEHPKRVASRLAGACRPIEVKGQDRRLG